MNVLMVADSFFPDTSGGSHRVMYEEAVKFVEHGHRVFVITPLRAGLSENETIDGISIIRYKKRKGALGFLDYLDKPCRIFNALSKKVRFDVVCGHWALTSYNIFKKSSGIKKIYCFHGPSFLEYKAEFSEHFTVLRRLFVKWIKHYEAKTIKMADKINVDSQYMENVLCSNFAKHGKIYINPLSCDTTKYVLPANVEEDKKAIGFNDKEINILTVRRLRKRMGIDLLIKSMLVVKDSIPNVHLYIGGTGAYRLELQKIVAECKLNKYVTFLGFIPEETIQKYYSSADLFVIPTLSLEGFGLVTLEALASGTPVVATDVCANSEVVGNYSDKLLCKADDYVDMGNTIVDVLQHLDDFPPDRNRKYVTDNYSWEQNYSRLMEIINGEK